MDPSEPIVTGQDLALRFKAAFPKEDWVARLAARSGRSRDAVEWHLQQEMLPPQDMLQAAAELLDEQATPRSAPEEAGAKP